MFLDQFTRDIGSAPCIFAGAFNPFAKLICPVCQLLGGFVVEV
ncbi:MAG TPA: hypothetical protein VH583_05690 [Vicinamibacterales bacterium]